MANRFPVVVTLPIVVLTGAVVVPFNEEYELLDIRGHLQAITLGSLTVNILNGTGDRIGQLVWSAPGLQQVGSAGMRRVSDQLQFDVVGIGVGGSGCTITVWCSSGS